VIVLDASVLIALLTRDDTHHLNAAQILANTPEQALATPSLTLAEALVKPARARRAAEAEALLRRYGIDEMAPSRPIDLALLRANSGLRMPDAVVLQAALDSGGRLATFDQRLAGSARQHGVPVLP